jgi:hypothetical protein
MGRRETLYHWDDKHIPMRKRFKNIDPADILEMPDEMFRQYEYYQEKEEDADGGYLYYDLRKGKGN